LTATHPFLGLCLVLAALPAHALEYRSTGRATVLYDAPSTAASRIAVAGPGLPLEIIVDTESWAKVRDPGGRLVWVEKAALGGPRTVMVKVDAGSVRRAPRLDADLVFRAARGVVLAVTGDADPSGWLPVKHTDGLAGWLPVYEVWGE
jgi:SH3-like domain-containing protein